MAVQSFCHMFAPRSIKSPVYSQLALLYLPFLSGITHPIRCGLEWGTRRSEYFGRAQA
jgi:hypothetical protein